MGAAGSRYAHYYERYANHEKAEKIALAKLPSIKQVLPARVEGRQRRSLPRPARVPLPSPCALHLRLRLPSSPFPLARARCPALRLHATGLERAGLADGRRRRPLKLAPSRRLIGSVAASHISVGHGGALQDMTDLNEKRHIPEVCVLCACVRVCVCVRARVCVGVCVCVSMTDPNEKRHMPEYAAGPCRAVPSAAALRRVYIGYLAVAAVVLCHSPFGAETSAIRNIPVRVRRIPVSQYAYC